MKLHVFILFLFISLNCQFSFGQKKDKWIVVPGELVDRCGEFVPNERVALLNKRGFDKQIVFSDSEGKFSFKVKKKSIAKLFIKYYSEYINTDKIQLNEFMNSNKLVLNFDYKKRYISCNPGSRVIGERTLDKMPFNYETNEMVLFLPMVIMVK